jgi:hypothetical protein
MDVTQTSPSLLDLPRLGRMALILRVAAGQSMEQVASIYRLAVVQVERQLSRQVQWLIDGLRQLRILPANVRVQRIAEQARFQVMTAVQASHLGAIEFTRRCWRAGRDPAVEIALMAERILRQVERVPEGLPERRGGSGGHPYGSRQTSMAWALSGDAEMDRLSIRYAYEMRDTLLIVEGMELAREQREIAAAAPDERARLQAQMMREGHAAVRADDRGSALRPLGGRPYLPGIPHLPPPDPNDPAIWDQLE